MRFKEIPKMDRPEWLKWRLKGIGSSDACIIMGRSRFKTYDELLLDKCRAAPRGENDDNKYIKDRGNKIEFQVREFLERKQETTFTALDTEMIEFPFLRASLDGISPNRETIIEIKLLSVINPDNPNFQAAGYKKWKAARDEGIVPHEYMPQIQHQLFVTGAKGCWFIGYKETRGNTIITPDKLAMVWVTPNEDFTSQMIDLELKFWYNVFKRKQQLQGDIL